MIQMISNAAKGAKSFAHVYGKPIAFCAVGGFVCGASAVLGGLIVSHIDRWVTLRYLTKIHAANVETEQATAAEDSAEDESGDEADEAKPHVKYEKPAIIDPSTVGQSKESDTKHDADKDAYPEDAPDHRAEVIFSDELGAIPDYQTVYLHYYTDGVIATEAYQPVSDFQEKTGIAVVSHFGEDAEDPDAVCIEDPETHSYYVVLRDKRAWDDVYPEYKRVEILTKSLGYLTDNDEEI